MSFKDLGLNDKTIQAITDLGYKEPTTVQRDVIPSVLAGRDIFIIAPSACGKTCSYIFPLIDIISKKQGHNILIITADDKEAVNVSDKLSIFNKYHELTEEENSSETIDNEANVIIGAPSLLLDNIKEEKIDISNINILVVDDINLIKKGRGLQKLDEILELLPIDKQNIVFTTRRSKETQDTLNKILKTPAEIKIDKNKESEAKNVQNEPTIPENQKKEKAKTKNSYKKSKDPLDRKAVELAKKNKAFGFNPPHFLLVECKLIEGKDF
ncbi:MAG: DEAD/DEAH box helicase [Alphaproteobacteria bacterium]|nr:DEAD/DEAH box helicase [Alphaproteobacteria bacterium]